jgi:hypothetical protein
MKDIFRLLETICQRYNCGAENFVLQWGPLHGCLLVVVVNSQRIGAVKIQTRRPGNIPDLDKLAEGIRTMVTQQSNQKGDQIAPGMKSEANQTETRPSRRAAKGTIVENWRQLSDPDAIAQAFPQHPSNDDIIDLYQRNKEIQSDKLAVLLKERAR